MKKPVRVKQRDASDCGAACLVSIAAYYGLHLPVSRIRLYAGTDKQGTSLSGLLEAAEKLHFKARGVKARGVPLTDIPVPSVFHLIQENGMQHFVVVYKIKKNRIIYMDPAFGRIVSKSRIEFETRWSGVVLLLLPSEQFRQGNEKKSVYHRFWHLILPHKNLLIQAMVGALIYTVLGLASSIYVQKIIDFVLPDENKSLMNSLGLIMIVLLCFQVLIGYFKSLLALKTGQQIDSRLILGYYKHLLELPQRFFDGMRVGEIISRVNDALRIRVFINDVALNVIVQTLTLVLSFIVMCIFYWKLALLMILAIPVYLVIYLISNRMNAKYQRRTMESGAALESQLVESIQGIATIRRFGSQAYFNLKTESRFIPFMRSAFISSHCGLLLSNAAEWVTSLLTISLLWTGSYFVMNRSISPGELLSFYTLTAFFTSPVQALIGSNRSMQDALIAADRLFEIIDLETERGQGEKTVTVKFPEGDLIIDRIHFNFGVGNPVFEDLDLRIPRYQITGIIGESGCGKSTLLSLIQKFYPVQEGRILLGDLDIKHISTSLIRKKIAAVPQQTDLFQGTIISNIALGEYEPDLERVLNICKKLGLDEFISQLPSGYQTMVREQGTNFSGGQKQRLGIARALYRDPEILILDEATSALDPLSEQKVQETLQWFYTQKKTIVLIAHRLATIRYCNSIIFLKRGGAAVCGIHENLLAENQEYADWWKKA